MLWWLILHIWNNTGNEPKGILKRHPHSWSGSQTKYSVLLRDTARPASCTSSTIASLSPPTVSSNYEPQQTLPSLSLVFVRCFVKAMRKVNNSHVYLCTLFTPFLVVAPILPDSLLHLHTCPTCILRNLDSEEVSMWWPSVWIWFTSFSMSSRTIHFFSNDYYFSLWINKTQ